MNCKTARGLFSLRFDEGLSYEEQRHLGRHLDSCTGCVTEYEKMERTIRLLRMLPELEPSTTFVQDVLRSVHGANSGDRLAPSDPSIWDRLRGSLSGFSWDGSPRWATAALGTGLVVLGLGVGISSSVLLMHSPDSPVTAQQAQPGSSVAPAVAAAVDPSASSGRASSETPRPSGPFEQLVQDMLHRAETTDAGTSDSTSAPPPDWNTGWDAAARGQQVGSSPTDRREQAREGSVYIVF